MFRPRLCACAAGVLAAVLAGCASAPANNASRTSSPTTIESPAATSPTEDSSPTDGEVPVEPEDPPTPSPLETFDPPTAFDAASPVTLPAGSGGGVALHGGKVFVAGSGSLLAIDGQTGETV